MADDIARLGFGVDSSELERGAKSLDKVEAAAQRTDTASEKLEAQLAALERTLRSLDTSVGRLATSFTKTAQTEERVVAASTRMVQGMGEIGRKTYEASVANERLVRGMSQTATEIKRVDDTAERASSGGLQRLIAQIASVATFVKSVQILSSYGQELSNLRSVAGATGDEFTKLNAKAQQLGRDTRYSATEAAAAMTELAKAGFSAEQVMRAIDGTLELAQAGGVGVAEAAEITANALNGMRLSVEDTVRVADVLVKTANDTVSGVRDIGEAFSFVAPVASGLKLSLEETAAAIGVLSDAGIQGSSAGTGLRRVLSELESPSKATTAVLQQMGVTTEQVRISNVGLTAALETLAKAGVDTGLALQLFGDRGGPAFEVLSAGLPKVQELTTSLMNAGGTAAQVSTVMNDNLMSAVSNLFSAIEGLVLSMGDAGLTMVLRMVIVTLTTLINVLSIFSPLIIGLGTFIAGVMVQRALLPMVTAIGSTITAMLGLNTATAAGTGIWAALGVVMRAHPILAIASIIVTVISAVVALSNATITWGEKTYTVGEILRGIVEVLQIFLKEVLGIEVALSAASKSADEAAKKNLTLAKTEKEAALRAAELARAQENLRTRLARTGEETERTTDRLRDMNDELGVLESGSRIVTGGYTGLGQSAMTAAASTMTLSSANNDNARSLATVASMANTAAAAYSSLASSASAASGGGGGSGGTGIRRFDPFGISAGWAGTKGSFQFQRDASQEEIASVRNAALSKALDDALGSVTKAINSGSISRDQAAALYDAIWAMASGPTMEGIKRLSSMPGGSGAASAFKKLKSVQYASKVLLPGTRIPGLNFDPKMTSAFPELAGFRGGGSFRIPGGGSGGDNVIPIFRAKRGETVSVSPSGARTGGSVSIQINNYGDMGTEDQARQTSRQLAIQLERSLKKVRQEA